MTGCAPQSITVFVDDCCPDVSFDDHVGQCVDNERPVTVTATVTPKDGMPFQAVLQDDSGTTLDQGASDGQQQVVLEGTGSYPGGDQKFSVRFEEPSYCSPVNHTVCVPECELDWCRWLRLAASFALAMALTFWVLNFGGNPTLGAISPWNPLTEAVRWTPLFFGLFLFWVLNPKCRSWCSLFKLLWHGFFGAALLLLLLLKCLALLGWIVSAVVVLLGFFFRWCWTSRCCPTKCDIAEEWLFLMTEVMVAMLAVLGLDHYDDLEKACRSSVAGILIAILTVIAVENHQKKC